MNFRFFAWLIGLVVVLCACGETNTMTPTAIATHTATPTRPAMGLPTAPPGWKIFKRSTYQIALPDTWQEVKLQADEIKSAIIAAQDRNPPLADVLRTLLESGQYKGFIFYATDENTAPRAQTVSIARAGLPPNQNIQSIASAYAKSLPDLVRGAQVSNVQAPLTINGMDTAAFGYSISFVDENEKLVELRGAQFLFVRDSGDAYLVTITGDASDVTFDATARKIAETFAADSP